MKKKKKLLKGIIITLFIFILSIVVIFFTKPQLLDMAVWKISSIFPTEVAKYDDVRGFIGNTGYSKDVSDKDLTNAGEIIPTLTFNQKTKWPEKNKMPTNCNPEEIMKNAMNPGLGIKDLHKQGITGKSVTVAIIDQPMYLDHPEFKDKIIKYKDFDCKSESSMHGPAVTSILVGNNIGTAPDCRVYYAAVPSWLADASYYAKALDWIISENNNLSDNNKIRVVSISAAPSGPGSPFNKNNDMWDKSVKEAEKAGILILDCTEEHGFISPCQYDTSDPDNIGKCIPGFPGRPWAIKDSSVVYVPTSPRTTAEEYYEGDCGYQYTGNGGLSWAIPYCAGVFAMGWQINPELTPEKAVELIMASAYKKDSYTNIINPKAFVELVVKSK